MSAHAAATWGRRVRKGCAALAIVCCAGSAGFAEPGVSTTTWRGLPAFRISDGKAEAIAVPQLGGRVMHFGRVGGGNFLWNGEPGSERREVALMWGGDKTYIGPHTMWPFTQPRMWPPPVPDVSAHEAATLEGGERLRMTSPAWPGYGTRVVRELAFDAGGDLVFTHTIEKAPAGALLGAVWVVTQTAPSDAVFVPLNPKSPYKDNVYWFGWGTPKEGTGATTLSPTLLRIRPVLGTSWKLGAHPARPALATVKDGVAFVQRADPQEGQYPEGADGAGLSVEVYHHDLPGPGEYTELEMLSPLRRLDAGATLTTRWSLHDVPREAPEAEVERLLGGGK